jgi:hypothetical protein
MTEIGDAKLVPIEEQCDDAIKHYHKISSAISTMEYYSIVPKALEFYKKIERFNNLLIEKKKEFTESERVHKESFIDLPANTREAMLDYFEMGRAVGVLNMIKWVEEVMRG